MTLLVPRDPEKFPAGKYEGALELSGTGIAGVGTALVTIRHQEPLTKNSMSGWDQGLWLGLGLVVFCCILWAGARVDGNKRDLVAGPLIVVAGVTLYPLVARLRDSDVPGLWWPIWLGAFGMVGGFFIAALKHRSGGATLQGGYRFGAAMALSFGAGITAWRSQYLNAPDWALTFESAFELIAVVGAATITAALLLLAPEPQTGGTGTETPAGTGRSGSTPTDTTIAGER